MEAFYTYLSQFPGFTDHIYELVKPHLSVQNLKNGEYLLKEGKVCKSIVFIEKGLFRQYYLNDGKEITHCFCKENSISCAYKSFITKQKSSISIQAIEPSRVLKISNESIQKLYKFDPFFQQLGRMASEAEYVIAENHKRFINDLSATQRYLHVLKTDKILVQRVQLNYLATYLQVSPETLSRIRNKTAKT